MLIFHASIFHRHHCGRFDSRPVTTWLFPSWHDPQLIHINIAFSSAGRYWSHGWSWCRFIDPFSHSITSSWRLRYIDPCHPSSCTFTNCFSANNINRFDSGEASGSRPRRTIAGTAKLLDPSNTEAPALPSHLAAINAQWAAAAAALEGRFSSSTLTAIPDPIGNRTPSPGKRNAQAASLSSSSSEEEIGHCKKGKSKTKSQYHRLLLCLLHLMEPVNRHPSARYLQRWWTIRGTGQKERFRKIIGNYGMVTDTPLGTKRPKKADEVDEDGVLVDIDVIGISRNTSKVRCADGGLDLAHFYEDKVKDITGDKTRESRKCKICKWVSFFCWRSDKTLKIIILWNRRTYVTSTTMLRRHLEREHKVGYLNSLLLILIPNADRQHTINGVGKMILQRNCPTLSNRPRKLQTSIEICYNRAILTAIFIKYHSRSELYLIQTNYSARLRLNGW